MVILPVCTRSPGTARRCWSGSALLCVSLLFLAHPSIAPAQNAAPVNQAATPTALQSAANQAPKPACDPKASVCPPAAQPPAAEPATAASGLPSNASDLPSVSLAEQSARLLQLATMLKFEVDRSSKDTLSMRVVRTAADIERLARDTEQKLKSTVAQK